MKEIGATRADTHAGAQSGDSFHGPRISKTSQKTTCSTPPSRRLARTVPSATMMSPSDSISRATRMPGWPTNASFSIYPSNAVLPRVWNAPGINHSTSSVRHARIACVIGPPERLHVSFDRPCIRAHHQPRLRSISLSTIAWFRS